MDSFLPFMYKKDKEKPAQQIQLELDVPAPIEKEPIEKDEYNSNIIIIELF